MIAIAECNLSEIGALALERRLIKWYGRIDIGTGCLRNMTDGGQGTSGRIFSEEHRKKISLAKKGKQIPWNKGKTGVYLKESNEKRRQSLLGKKHPIDRVIKNKIGQSRLLTVKLKSETMKRIWKEKRRELV